MSHVTHINESCHTYQGVTSPASGSWQTALKKLANLTAPAPPTLAEILKSQLYSEFIYGVVGSLKLQVSLQNMVSFIKLFCRRDLYFWWVKSQLYSEFIYGVSMGWLRLAGSLKLQVSFAEYGLFYRALLQKRRIILRGLKSALQWIYRWGGYD